MDLEKFYTKYFVHLIDINVLSWGWSNLFFSNFLTSSVWWEFLKILFYHLYVIFVLFKSEAAMTLWHLLKFNFFPILWGNYFTNCMRLHIYSNILAKSLCWLDCVRMHFLVSVLLLRLNLNFKFNFDHSFITIRTYW